MPILRNQNFPFEGKMNYNGQKKERFLTSTESGYGTWFTAWDKVSFIFSRYSVVPATVWVWYSAIIVKTTSLDSTNLGQGHLAIVCRVVVDEYRVDNAFVKEKESVNHA